MADHSTLCRSSPKKTSSKGLRCFAYKCKNYKNSFSKARGVTFHKFPNPSTDAERYKVWSRNCGQKKEPRSHTLLCSAHFEAEKIDRTGQIVRLRQGAIPTKFNFSDDNSQDSVEVDCTVHPPSVLARMEGDDGDDSSETTQADDVVVRVCSVEDGDGDDASETTQADDVVVRVCSAPHCDSRTGQPPNIKLFRFPVDPARCRKWVQNANAKLLEHKPASKLHAYYFLCSKHFEDTQYHPLDPTKLNIYSAVPTIFDAPRSPAPSQADVQLTKNTPVTLSTDAPPPAKSVPVPGLASLHQSALTLSSTGCKVAVFVSDSGGDNFYNYGYSGKALSCLADSFANITKDRNLPTPTTDPTAMETSTSVSVATDSPAHAAAKSTNMDAEPEEPYNEQPAGHSYSAERRYQCPHCPKRFRSSAHLRDHVNLHLGLRPYKCDQCSYTAVQASALVFHKRTHSGDRPFACDKCDFRAVKSADLKRHASKHSGEKPHACEVCDFRTAYRPILRKHMERHGVVLTPSSPSRRPSHSRSVSKQQKPRLQLQTLHPDLFGFESPTPSVKEETSAD